MAFYAFFDPTDAADLALLPEAVRTDPDLASMCEVAERDVIQFYSERTTDDDIEVLLEGWDADAPATSDAGLLEELRYTIGRVVGHRLVYKSLDPSLSRVKLADWEAEFGGDQSSIGVLWPNGWSLALDRFYSNKAPWYTI